MAHQLIFRQQAQKMMLATKFKPSSLAPYSFTTKYQFTNPQTTMRFAMPQQQQRGMAKKSNEYDEYQEMLYRARHVQNAAKQDVRTSLALQRAQDDGRTREIKTFRDQTETAIPKRFLLFGGILLTLLVFSERLWSYHIDYYGEPPNPTTLFRSGAAQEQKNPLRGTDLIYDEAAPAPIQVKLSKEDTPSF
eukprot:UN00623